jgi:hypothetical protein
MSLCSSCTHNILLNPQNFKGGDEPLGATTQSFQVDSTRRQEGVG